MEKGAVGKRGITNIEMIVAVTIFIFSVILVVYYITFVGFRQEPAEIFLATLEKNLRNETEVAYNMTYLKAAGSGADCINVSRHSSIIDVHNVSIIKGESLVDFDVRGSWLILDSSPSQNEFVIYAFQYPVTSNHELDCSSIDNLTEGQEYNYSILSEGKMFVNDTLYNLDYKNFKNKWKMQKDFYISVMDASGTALFTKGTSANILGVPVRASQFKSKMIYSNGNINDIIINLQVW